MFLSKNVSCKESIDNKISQIESLADSGRNLLASIIDKLNLEGSKDPDFVEFKRLNNDLEYYGYFNLKRIKLNISISPDLKFGHLIYSHYEKNYVDNYTKYDLDFVYFYGKKFSFEDFVNSIDDFLDFMNKKANYLLI